MEIIKTDDPNIVIERTVIDKKINISDVTFRKVALENHIESLNSKKTELEALTVTGILKELLDKEMQNLLGEIFSAEQELESLNLLLS